MDDLAKAAGKTVTDAAGKAAADAANKAALDAANKAAADAAAAAAKKGKVGVQQFGYMLKLDDVAAKYGIKRNTTLGMNTNNGTLQAIQRAENRISKFIKKRDEIMKISDPTVRKYQLDLLVKEAQSKKFLKGLPSDPSKWDLEDATKIIDVDEVQKYQKRLDQVLIGLGILTVVGSLSLIIAGAVSDRSGRVSENEQMKYLSEEETMIKINRMTQAHNAKQLSASDFNDALDQILFEVQMFKVNYSPNFYSTVRALQTKLDREIQQEIANQGKTGDYTTAIVIGSVFFIIFFLFFIFLSITSGRPRGGPAVKKAAAARSAAARRY